MKGKIIFAIALSILVALAIAGASYIGIAEPLWAWVVGGIFIVALCMFGIEIHPRCGCGTCPPDKTCMPGPN